MFGFWISSGVSGTGSGRGRGHPLSSRLCAAAIVQDAWVVRAWAHAQSHPRPQIHNTQELGALLGVSPEKAEGIAADMILDGRLPGTIDQVRGKGTGDRGVGLGACSAPF